MVVFRSTYAIFTKHFHTVNITGKIPKKSGK